MSDWIPTEVWLDQAKRLPVGGRMMDIACCKATGSRDGLLITHKSEGYSAYCFRCKSKGWHSKGERSIDMIRRERDEKLFRDSLAVSLPGDFTLDIPSKHLVWLLSGGVFPTVAKSYGIGYSSRLNRVILPVYVDGTLTFIQGRDTLGTSHAKYIAQSNVPKGDVLAWSHKLDKPLRDDVLVLTEDFLSTIVVGCNVRSVAMLGTSLSNAQMGALLRSPYRKIVVWLDDDYAGIQAARTITKALRLAGFQATSVRTKQDPKKQPKRVIHKLIGEIKWI